jgi:hypothetical protein
METNQRLLESGFNGTLIFCFAMVQFVLAIGLTTPSSAMRTGGLAFLMALLFLFYMLCLFIAALVNKDSRRSFTPVVALIGILCGVISLAFWSLSFYATL